MLQKCPLKTTENGTRISLNSEFKIEFPEWKQMAHTNVMTVKAMILNCFNRDKYYHNRDYVEELKIRPLIYYKKHEVKKNIRSYFFKVSPILERCYDILL